MQRSYVQILFSLLLAFSLCSESVYGSNDVEAKAQLEISETTLFESGSNEKNRVNAAVLLLLRKEPDARRILLSALTDANNSVPKIAVCKALTQSSTWDESIYNKNDFIEPLLGMLKNGGEQEGKAAAEALLIYDYQEISKKLISIIKDGKVVSKNLDNVIYALRLRPDKDAMLDLIDLVDSDDKNVSSAAAGALEKLLGVPAGADKSEWRRISSELKKKSKDEFISDRLVRQYDKVRRLEEELGGWKELYFNSLNRFYDQLPDDAAKEGFIASQLGDNREEIILWALDKLSGWVRSGKSVSVETSKLLLGHVSSISREVRLETSKLLASLGYTGPAEALFAQIKVENDPAVRLEQFKALGEAIYFGLSPGSQIKIDNNIRQETLKIAGDYLDSNDISNSVTAVKVIQKLLEQNGLDNSIAKSYFQKISDRYVKIGADKADERGEFITSMSRLCQGSSFYRTDASGIFRPLFEQGLGDKGLLVRQSSIVGLENIDPAGALKLFREKKIYDDSVESVRMGIYDVTEKFGGGEDLAWLSGKLAVNGDSKAAWKAFMAIIGRLDGQTGLQWVEKIKKLNVNSENYLRLLNIVEKKLVQDNGKGVPVSLKLELAKTYKSRGDLDNSLKYYNEIVGDPNIGDGLKDEITVDLAELYVQKQDFAKAGEFISAVLAKRDLSKDESLVESISGFLSNDSVSKESKSGIMAVLSSIDAKDRPVWKNLLGDWGKKAGLTAAVPDANVPSSPAKQDTEQPKT